MQLDEFPVNSKNSAMAEFPDQKEEDFSNIPLDSLLIHSNWKARKSGCERVLSDPNGGKFSFFSALNKLSQEGNAATQEVFLEAAVSMVPLCTEEELSLLCEGPLKLALDKCITGRPRCAQAGQQLASDLVGAGKQTTVMDALASTFSHKNPKNRIASAQLCASIINDFGVQHFPMKVILKSMQPLFNDANALARKSVLTLCCQCYKYMGNSLKSYLTDLRDVQLQELETQFQTVTLGEKPPKVIRGFSTPPAPTSAKFSTPVGQSAARGSADDLMNDFAEMAESPVLSRLPRNFYQTVLDKSITWQDRCEMVNNSLLPLLSVPKIRIKDDYHELASMIKEFLIDPQAPLMLLGFKLVQEMARTLRNGFSVYARSYIGPLFEKMKDKKTSVLEHIMKTLETLILYNCITLDQCQEEIESTSHSKNPSQRLALINWLIRVVENLDASQMGKLSRSEPLLRRFLNDEKSEIRETSYVLVSRLISLFGEGAYQSLIDGMDSKQSAKLASLSSSKPLTTVTPSSSPAKKLQKLETKDSSLACSRIRPRRLSLTEVTANSAATSHRGPTPATDAVSLEAALPTKDEVMRQMLGLCNGDTNIVPLLRSKEWQQRLDGVGKVQAVTNTWNSTQCTKYLDTVLVYLKTDPGWKESIFQVFQAMVSVMRGLMERSVSLSPSAGYALIAGCAPRLTEPKNKPAIRELLTAISARLGTFFVVTHVIGSSEVKTPKFLLECNDYLLEVLKNNGTVDVAEVVDYIKQHCADPTAPAVRSSAVQVLLALRQVAGAPAVDSGMRDCAVGLRHAYETELNRLGQVLDQSAPASSVHTKRNRYMSHSPSRIGHRPTTSSRGGSMRPTVSATHSSARGDSPNPFPIREDRNDLHSDVSISLKEIIQDITKNSDWRLRLEAVKNVSNYIAHNQGRISETAATELLKALRSRFDETNKNFIVDVLQVIPLVVEAAGYDASRVAMRRVVPGVLNMLGDQKIILREEAAKVSYLGLQTLGLESMLGMMLKPLTADAHISRLTALEIIDTGFQQLTPDTRVPRTCVHPLLLPVVKCCMDRISDVRAVSERVIGHFIRLVGEDAVLRVVNQLRPAEQQSVMGAIERQLQINLVPSMENEEAQFTPITNYNSFKGNSSLSSAHRAAVSPSKTRNSANRNPNYPATRQSSESSSNAAPPLPMVIKDAPGATGRLSANSMNRNNERSLGSSFPGETLSSQTNTNDAIQTLSQSDQKEEFYTIQEISVGMRSASNAVAYTMCTDFMRHLRNGEDCGSPEIIQAMVERLYENCKGTLDEELSLGITNCLSALFMSPKTCQRCHSSLLFRLLGTLFECLLKEQFSLYERAVKGLNNMILKLIEGCPPNDVFSALMSRMTSYSPIYLKSGEKTDLKYIQLTVKCIMRLDMDNVLPENIILCCHEYLLQHPPSAFRNRDDFSIRTVKTILQNVTRKHGEALLQISNALIGPQNLVTHFIRACLETRERSAKARSENEQQAEEESRQQQRASLSPAPMSSVSPSRSFVMKAPESSTTNNNNHTNNNNNNNTAKLTRHVDPATSAASFSSISVNGILSSTEVGGVVSDQNRTQEMANYFNRIRNHSTSSQAITELYNYLKQTSPSSDERFAFQYNRCTEAFRLHIKRKLETHFSSDDKKPADFKLPPVLGNSIQV